MVSLKRLLRPRGQSSPAPPSILVIPPPPCSAADCGVSSNHTPGHRLPREFSELNCSGFPSPGVAEQHARASKRKFLPTLKSKWNRTLVIFKALWFVDASSGSGRSGGHSHGGHLPHSSRFENSSKAHTKFCPESYKEICETLLRDQSRSEYPRGSSLPQHPYPLPQRKCSIVMPRTSLSGEPLDWSQIFLTQRDGCARRVPVVYPNGVQPSHDFNFQAGLIKIKCSDNGANESHTWETSLTESYPKKHAAGSPQVRFTMSCPSFDSFLTRESSRRISERKPRTSVASQPTVTSCVPPLKADVEPGNAPLPQDLVPRKVRSARTSRDGRSNSLEGSKTTRIPSLPLTPKLGMTQSPCLVITASSPPPATLPLYIPKAVQKPADNSETEWKQSTAFSICQKSFKGAEAGNPRSEPTSPTSISERCTFSLDNDSVCSQVRRLYSAHVRRGRLDEFHQEATSDESNSHSATRSLSPSLSGLADGNKLMHTRGSTCGRVAPNAIRRRHASVLPISRTSVTEGTTTFWSGLNSSDSSFQECVIFKDVCWYSCRWPTLLMSNGEARVQSSTTQLDAGVSLLRWSASGTLW